MTTVSTTSAHPHEHPRGMQIGVVNGPRSLVENHQTKLRTWKSVRHSRCTMSSTLLQTEHTGKCTLVKVFLFNWVQVFISCVWTRSHQTPSDTSSDETRNNNVALPQLWRVPIIPNQSRKDICVHSGTSHSSRHCETNDILITINTNHSHRQKYAPTLVLATTQP